MPHEKKEAKAPEPAPPVVDVANHVGLKTSKFHREPEPIEELPQEPEESSSFEMSPMKLSPYKRSPNWGGLSYIDEETESALGSEDLFSKENKQRSFNKDILIVNRMSSNKFSSHEVDRIAINKQISGLTDLSAENNGDSSGKNTGSVKNISSRGNHRNIDFSSFLKHTQMHPFRAGSPNVAVKSRTSGS